MSWVRQFCIKRGILQLLGDSGGGLKFLFFNGYLFSLTHIDGRKSSPVNHGPTTPETFLTVSLSLVIICNCRHYNTKGRSQSLSGIHDT